MPSRPPSEEPVELIDAHAPAVTTTSSVSKGKNTQALLGLVLGVGLLLGTVWWLAAGRSASDATPTGEDQAEEDATENEAAAATTTTRPERRTSSSTPSTSSAGGPIIPGSGLSLLMGGPQKWRVVDLDSGEIREVGQRGDVMLATDDYVLSYWNDQLQAVPLADLDSEPIPLAGVSPEMVGSDDDGNLWLLESGSQITTGRFNLVAIDSGDVLETREVPIGIRSLGFGFRSGPTLDIVSPPSGGIYVYDGDGYRRVLAGSLITSTSGVALVDQCDDDLACTFEWRDARTWELLDRPVPPRNFDAATLLGDGQWLLMTSWRSWSFELFDTRTGEVRDLSELAPGDHGPPVFSPDGRWMANVGSGALTVTELETMETVEAEGRWSDVWSMALIETAPAAEE